MNRRKLVIILTAVAIVLCLLVLAIPGSSPADPVSVAAPTPTQQPTAAPASVAAPTSTQQPTLPPDPTATPTPDLCQSVQPELLAAIAQGLTVSGGGSLPQGAAYRSPDHEQVWYIAARIAGEGIDNVIGVWATNRLDASGMILSVDAIANEFSDWADGRTTDAQLNTTDPGAVRARQCLEKSTR
jgi:hypothetical protein